VLQQQEVSGVKLFLEQILINDCSEWLMWGGSVVRTDIGCGLGDWNACLSFDK
jgi:hypothetical protein